jgi:hypothetical protein
LRCPCIKGFKKLALLIGNWQLLIIGTQLTHMEPDFILHYEKARDAYYVKLSLTVSDGRVRKSVGKLDNPYLFPDAVPKPLRQKMNAVELRVVAYINSCIAGNLPVLKERVEEITDTELKGVVKVKKTGFTLAELLQKYKAGMASHAILNNGAYYSEASIHNCNAAIQTTTLSGLGNKDVSVITKEDMLAYQVWLSKATSKRTKRKYSQNTIYIYTTSIFTAMAYYFNKLHKNPLHKDDDIRTGGEDVDIPVFYSIPELLQLNALKLTGMHERARDIFLYGCFAGFRRRDYQKHDSSHIENGLITINTSKRNVDASVPVSPIINTILEKYENNPPKMSDMHFVKCIQQICKDAGFTELIRYKHTVGGKRVEIIKPRYKLTTWHTMRRTCATNMALGCAALGIPPIDSTTIIKMMGWKTDKMLRKYVKASAQNFAKQNIDHPFFNVK